MEEPQNNALTATFPTPPPFYQYFTPENISRIAELRAQETQSHSENTNATIRILDLPAELRYLQPPEPPSDRRYRCFGDVYNLNDELPSLEEQGITQLYDLHGHDVEDTGNGKHADRAFILKRIAKSLLLNFLELVGIMSVNPEQYAEKIQDLRTLFINFHHLLNEYRPHQARESLILMMQDQLDRSRAETEGILKMKGEVEGVLAGLGKSGLGDVVEEDAKNDKVLAEEGEDVWAELNQEFE